jgi:hypothetical protein
MSGITVIKAKLHAYAPLVAIVPVIRIKGGVLPLDIAVPAISITTVGSVQRFPVKRAATGNMHTETVRVSVIVSNDQTASAGTGLAGMEAILRAVLAACSETRGTVASIAVDSINPGAQGPFLPTDAPNWLTGSRDFVVRWTD